MELRINLILKMYQKALGFEEYKIFLEDYTPEKVAKYSKVSVKDIKYLANIYGNPNTKVVSYWCMGMNQHTVELG